MIFSRRSTASQWPQLTGTFDWAIDWFDVIARDNDRIALWIVEEAARASR